MRQLSQNQLPIGESPRVEAVGTSRPYMVLALDRPELIDSTLSGPLCHFWHLRW